MDAHAAGIGQTYLAAGHGYGSVSGHRGRHAVAPCVSTTGNIHIYCRITGYGNACITRYAGGFTRRPRLTAAVNTVSHNTAG